MAIQYTYDVYLGVINTRLDAVVTFKDAEAHFMRMTVDSTIPEGFVELVHFEAVESFKMEEEDIPRFQELMQQVVNTRGYRGAVLLVRNDFQYGIARMFHNIVQQIAPVEIAQSEDEVERYIRIIKGEESPDPAE